MNTSIKLSVAISAMLLAPLVNATEIAYTPDSSDFTNPERGFYYQLESNSAAPQPLTAGELQSIRGQGISVVRRLFNMTTFRDSAISSSYLQQISNDFNTARANGFKLNVRFAYTFNEAPPHNDATIDRIESHIDQLAPLLVANTDVISHLDAGFIGRWGEWHTSSNSNDTPANMTRVLNKLLTVLPASRSVVVRTPGYKRVINNRMAALTETEAFSGSNISRTGHLNDCFLTDASDSGTYLGNAAEIQEQKNYIAAETKYTPMSGETCRVEPRANCSTALAEMSQLHWSILNYTYHPDVLQGWRNQGCFDDIKRRLGYRFELINASLNAIADVGRPFPITIKIKNSGFAAPFNARPVHLIFESVSTGKIVRLPLRSDPRKWLPDVDGGIHNISESVVIPQKLARGQYRLYLDLPDASPALNNQSAFHIRMANQGTWDAVRGYNALLHTVFVTTPRSIKPPPNSKL
jgi:Domain of unknown function (DUF4832)/Domain of unknown function (DUF4874)